MNIRKIAAYLVTALIYVPAGTSATNANTPLDMLSTNEENIYGQNLNLPSLSPYPMPTMHMGLQNTDTQTQFTIASPNQNVHYEASIRGNVDTIPPSPCSTFVESMNIGVNMPNDTSLNFPSSVFTAKKEWFEAVGRNDLDDLKRIRKNYSFPIDIISNEGDTAFLIACKLQNKDIVDYLAGQGANKKARDKKGWTAFHLSCIQGNKNFTTWLVEYHQINPYKITTTHQYTGFHIACMNGHVEFASFLTNTLLLSKEATDKNGSNALDLISIYDCRSKEQVGSYLRSIGLKANNTPQNQRVSSVANPNNHAHTSFIANTTTHPPASYFQSQAVTAIDTDTLQESNAKQAMTEEVKKNWFVSARGKDLEKLQHIIKNYDIDIDMSDADGNTAFLIACSQQDMQMARYLLANQCDRHVTNHEGWNAFHLSCKKGNQTFITWLLVKGINQRLTTADGQTGLDIANSCNHEALASYLRMQETFSQNKEKRNIKPSKIKNRTNTYTDNKCFGCHTCTKYFSSTKDVIQHMKTHLAERPFECALCKRRFRQKEKLTSHQRKPCKKHPIVRF
ncbi:MAG: ankyrin repeat domain-containing protein [Bacteroidota bacterium]